MTDISDELDQSVRSDFTNTQIRRMDTSVSGISGTTEVKRIPTQSQSQLSYDE